MKRATLTKKENRDWEELFAFYINQGFDDAKADAAAWKDLQGVYPRLQPFKGCKP